MATLLSEDELVRIGEPSEGGGTDGGGDSGGEGGSDGEGRWVAVATFWTPAQAHLARLKLESEGIDCQIANENIVAMDFLLAPAVGGIKILVRELERERAEALLDGPGEAPAEVIRISFCGCPECGSKNICRPVFGVKTFWAACVAMMMMGSVVMLPLGLGGFVYYMVMWRPWRCRDCRNSFLLGKDGPEGFEMGENLRVR